MPLRVAVTRAQEYLNRGLVKSYAPGEGFGPPIIWPGSDGGRKEGDRPSFRPVCAARQPLPGNRAGARLFVRTGYFRQVKLFSIVPEILMSGLPPSSCAAQP